MNYNVSYNTKNNRSSHIYLSGIRELIIIYVEILIVYVFAKRHPCALSYGICLAQALLDGKVYFVCVPVFAICVFVCSPMCKGRGNANHTLLEAGTGDIDHLH